MRDGIGGAVPAPDDGMARAGRIGAMLARFRARLCAERMRMPDSPYLEYVGKIADPDLSSTILIEIPAYMDPEIVNTVRAARAMAANPDRLRFAVCLQDDDAGKLDALYGIPHMRIKYFDPEGAPGLCAARHHAQRLYDGEDFAFHVDSHMRFARFWDAAIIDQWRLCGSDRAILTEYAAPLKPEWLGRPLDDPCFTEGAETRGCVINAFYFSGSLPELRFRVGRWFDGPMPRMGAFMSGHYLFCRGEADRRVPADPYMDFTADECAMAARYWTHGFDFYHPGMRFAYHMYMRSDAYGGKPVLPDPGGAAASRKERQGRRLEKLLGMRPRKDVDLAGYDLGTERSLAGYQAFCGVDFRHLSIRDFAARGLFDEPHGADDTESFDWEKAYRDHYGKPPAEAGRVLGIRIDPEIASGFLGFCAERGWHPQAALAEAIGSWLDRT